MQSIDQADVVLSFNAVAMSAPLNGTPFALAGLQPGMRARSRRIRWRTSFGVAPTAISLKLQGCIGDPTVAANWFGLDSSTDLNGESKEIEALVLFVRAQIASLTIGAGTTCTVEITT
jgi:hypothetical protein